MFLDVEVRCVACRSCKAVKRERLDFLADNPRYTKRFAFYVGRRCRSASIKEVATELHLDWHAVKEVEKQYMREQLRKLHRAGTPGPKVIGIDEISIRKRHTYRIVVSDLERRRPIWFGGDGRSEADMDMFFAELGPRKSAGIRLAGDGHVEAVSQFHRQACAEGEHPVRQVPHPAPPRGRAR